MKAVDQDRIDIRYVYMYTVPDSWKAGQDQKMNDSGLNVSRKIWAFNRIFNFRAYAEIEISIL